MRLDSTRHRGGTPAEEGCPVARAEAFCGVFDYGGEEAAVSAGAASPCRRCLRFLSRELLRQSAEAARPADAICFRRYVFKCLAV